MPTAKEIKEQQRLQKIEMAKRKLAKGEIPTKEELNFLAKAEQAELEEKGIEFTQKCPKRVFLEQTGSKTGNLHKLADSHEIPLRGDTLNLWAIITRLLELPNQYRLAGIRRTKSAAEELLFDDEGDDGWQDKCFQEKYYALRDDRLIRQRSLVPAEIIHDAHTKWAALLRDAGHKLGLEYDEKAQSILNEAVDNCVRVIEDVLSDWNAAAYADEVLPEGSQEQFEESASTDPAESQGSTNPQSS